MPHDDVEDYVPDNSMGNLRPHGSRIRMKTPTGWAVYELTPQGWKLIREEKE